MKIYEVNMKRLALLLLPPSYRKPLLAAFAKSMVRGINEVYNRFIRYREEKRYRLSYNGQVCKMRGLLNNLFDSTEQRIRIRDIDRDDAGMFLWRRSEKTGLLVGIRKMGGTPIYKRGYMGSRVPDFAVELPLALYGSIDEDRLQAVVKQYKLASKRFRISYY